MVFIAKKCILHLMGRFSSSLKSARLEVETGNHETRKDNRTLASLSLLEHTQEARVEDQIWVFAVIRLKSDQIHGHQSAALLAFPFFIGITFGPGQNMDHFVF